MVVNLTYRVVTNPSQFLKDVKQDKTALQKLADFFERLLEGFKNMFTSAERQSVKKAYDLLVKAIKNAKTTEVVDVSAVGVDSTSIKFDLEFDQYPYNMQTVIKDYLNHIDSKVLELVEKVRKNEDTSVDKVYFEDVDDSTAQKISELVGFEVKGFQSALDAKQVRHIINGHGENGRHNESMKNDFDIARMEYVLKNYDEIELTNRVNAYKTNENGRIKKSKAILYSKKINCTYYLVQAVPNTKAKTLQIVTAFIDNKKRVMQFTIDNNALGATSDNEITSTLSTSIRNNSQKVNTNSQNNTAKYDLDDIPLPTDKDAPPMRGRDRQDFGKDKVYLKKDVKVIVDDVLNDALVGGTYEGKLSASKLEYLFKELNGGVNKSLQERELATNRIVDYFIEEMTVKSYLVAEGKDLSVEKVKAFKEYYKKVNKILKMAHNSIMENTNLQLAQKRTKLANIRTFLSYIRTSLLSLSVALAFVKLDKENPLDFYSITLLIFSAIFLIIGLVNFFITNHSILSKVNEKQF